jgi:hypothetical protein
MNSRTVPDDPVTRGDTFLEKLLLIAFHAKIVRHREHAAHRIDVNPSLIPVALSGNYPLDRHPFITSDTSQRAIKVYVGGVQELEHETPCGAKTAKSLSEYYH